VHLVLSMSNEHIKQIAICDALVPGSGFHDYTCTPIKLSDNGSHSSSSCEALSSSSLQRNIFVSMYCYFKS
jgi:hypothetical protein